MKRVLMLVGAWAGATLAAAVVAWAAVGIVDDQVSADVDLPLTAAEVEEISAARVTMTTVPTVTTTISTPTTTDATPTTTVATPTTTVSGPTSTVPATTSAPTVPTTTTAVPAPTTTTAPATTTTATPTTTATELTEAIRVNGGSVVIRWSPSGGVRLTSATPDSGWSVDVEHGGPPSVEVKFEGPGDTETEVHVEVSNGALKVEVSDD